MNQSKKCVMVINHQLPLGLVANAAAILGCTLGKDQGEIVGRIVADGSGTMHRGIVQIPIPILSSTKDGLKELYHTIREQYSEAITLISFNDIAQRSKDYEDYADKMAAASADDLSYLGLCLYGEKKAVNHLTGSLPMLK
ncbi:DUF2000 domain-containing protein [Sporolactobacillus putidus]|uniref:DUF2000 domain-containing protein n=1 Tax=Sporolactobacillus putidus TaxID=492735 RepID=A0A917W0V0_9BACL|nr:DUF2000 domain-containing protein [Sporolactobacillus putidus]GGL54996.1 hypothetical protein GCM10007968_18840 [Sporolactobacillus putidus]